MRNTIIFALFSIFGAGIVNAQEQTGLRLDNYAGVNSLMINPANNLNSRFKWDVNLIAAGAFTQTNYGYFENTRLSELLKNTDNIFLASDFDDESEIRSDMLIFEYANDSRNRHGLVSTFVSGPGFMVNLDGRHSFGLFTGARVMASAQNLPNSLSYSYFDDTPYGQSILIPPFSLSAMSWIEIGINYAFAKDIYPGKLGFGISLKHLSGYEAFYLTNNITADIVQLTGDSLDVNTAGFEYGLTTTAADGNYSGLSKNGSGWAVDLGASLVLGESEEGYSWKLGISLLDIGRIKFDANSVLHQLDLASPVTLDARDYDQLDNYQDYINTLSRQLLNDPEASLKGRAFDLWLPAALSLQADYQASPDFFISGLIVQRLPLSPGLNILQRSNLLALSPRFEHRWFGASLPLLLYNWQDFRLGSSIRLGFLTIGTDHLGSLLKKGTFSGTDFYLALKLNPFEIWERASGPGRRNRSGKGDVKCYKF